MSDLSTASLRRLRIKKALSTITTLRAVASASEWWSCLGVIVDRVFILSYSISITLEARRVFYANIHEWRLCLWILAAKQASRSLPDVTVEFTLSPSLNSFWSLWSKRVPPAHKSLLSKGPKKSKKSLILYLECSGAHWSSTLTYICAQVLEEKQWRADRTGANVNGVPSRRLPSQKAAVSSLLPQVLHIKGPLCCRWITDDLVRRSRHFFGRELFSDWSAYSR